MAELILPRRFKAQPQYPAPIDFSGVGRGLRGFWIREGGSQLLRNKVTGVVPSAFSGTVTPVVSPYGLVDSFLSGSLDTGEAIDITGEITIAVRMRGIADDGRRLFGNHGNGTTGYLLAHTTSTNVAFYTDATLRANATIAFDTWTQVAFSSIGGNILSSVDGRVTTSAGTATLSSQSGTVKIGAYNWTGFADYTGYIEYIALWGRGLLASELRAFQSNPYQVIKAPARRLWAIPASGITLVGAGSSEANASATGAISQTHALSGANSTQANTGETGAITQTLTLTGAASTQANTASTAAISQAHVLAGANALQANTASASAVTQTQVLAGANSSQANTASTGVISQGGVFVGSNCAQANSASTGGIAQTHVLAAANSGQANTASTGAISQGAVNDLAAASATQANSASTGAITQVHVLVHAPSVQDNVASASAIVKAHVLAAANGSQGNASSAASIIIGSAEITSVVEKTAIFRATVSRTTKFQRSKSVTVPLN